MSVTATSVLQGAGRTGTGALAADGSGTVAPAISLAAGTNRILTFSSITGAVKYNPMYSSVDPDGIGFTDSQSVTAYQGISGFSYTGHEGFLLGVFINGAPTGFATGSSGSNATTTSYTTAGDGAFTSISPSLNQAFFIGDGLTGDGTGVVQQFFVPNGATALVLGFEDSTNYAAPSSYADNSGSFTATFNISGAAAPEPGSLELAATFLTVSYLFALRRSA